MVAKKKNEILKVLEKSKTEENPDLAELRRRRDDRIRAKAKLAAREARAAAAVEAEAAREAAELRSYSTMFSGADMRSNRGGSLEDEDDFM